jgi:hypothetical protein
MFGNAQNIFEVMSKTVKNFYSCSLMIQALNNQLMSNLATHKRIQSVHCIASSDIGVRV